MIGPNRGDYICHAHQVRGVEPTVRWQTRLRRGGRAAN